MGRKQQRPFSPRALRRFAIHSVIRARIGSEGVAYRYNVLVPVQEVTPGKPAREVATTDDLDRIESMLADDFGGVTASATVPALRGRGARDPKDADDTRETNTHQCFTVYAAAVGESDGYFRALRRELEEALGEGVILVERQEVTFL